MWRTKKVFIEDVRTKQYVALKCLVFSMVLEVSICIGLKNPVY